MKTSLGIFITLVTYLARMIITALIKFIGIASLSKETKIIKDAVFGFSFFNTGCMYLLMNADFAYLNIFFTGKYSDFNKQWYSDIGSVIISSLMFTAVYPALELMIFGGLNYLSRVMDQGLNCCYREKFPSKTKARSIFEYFNIYAGP